MEWVLVEGEYEEDPSQGRIKKKDTMRSKIQASSSLLPCFSIFPNLACPVLESME